MELLDMFCALNGATETPWRASHRQSPAVTRLLPASEVVPATSSPLATTSPHHRHSYRSEGRTADLRLLRPDRRGLSDRAHPVVARVGRLALCIVYSDVPGGSTQQPRILSGAMSYQALSRAVIGHRSRPQAP